VLKPDRAYCLPAGQGICYTAWVESKSPQPGREFFTAPQQMSQRRYEALRAHPPRLPRRRPAVRLRQRAVRRIVDPAQKSALTDYSYRLSHDHQRAVLTALDTQMISSGLPTAEEGIFDLDFHAVMHWGHDPVPEKHCVPTRSDRRAYSPRPPPGRPPADTTVPSWHERRLHFEFTQTVAAICWRGNPR
jgi:hypothetical protein